MGPTFRTEGIEISNQAIVPQTVDKDWRMAQLTCGERIVRCLIGEPVDRVPFGVGIGWWPWGDALANWQRDSGDATLNIAERFGYDGGFASPAIHAGIFPAFERQTLEESEQFIIWRDERGITRRDRRDGASMPEFLDYPVKTADDWDQLKTERLRLDDAGRIVEDWDAFRAQLAGNGYAVQVGSFPYGVFGTPRDLMGVEELLVSFYTQPELIHNIMDHLTSLWLAVWERVAAEVRIDHIHIWEDMSGRQGSLISPTMAAEFMMPCYDRIADFAEAHDVRIVSVDTDGDCSELVPLMMRHGINMFLPFEVQAGNDILDYRRRYPDLGIIGGLDKRALADSKAAVDEEVERAAAMTRLGRYVPGFDHLIPPDAKWELFAYAAERIKDVCYHR